MKVLIIPSWYVTEDSPGNGIFFKEQAEALIEAGNEVCVAYPDLRFKLGSLRRGLFKVSGGVDTYIYRRRTLTPFIERGRWPQRRLMLERLYQRVLKDHGRPDVVHLHSCRMGVETLGLCKKHSLPLVYTEHYCGIMDEKMAAPLEYAFKKTLFGCNAAIAVSESLLVKMKSLRTDAVVIPNAVNMKEFRRTAPIKAGGGFLFGAVGNLIERKRFDLLIEAFAKASPEMPEARLVIAGDGALKGELLKTVSTLNLKDRVELCGYIERRDAPEFFERLSCLVCSSRLETFGVTVIEALACGKPVISTRCGGPEGIVKSSNGLLVDNGDAAALAEAMVKMYHNIASFDSVKISADCAGLYSAEAVTHSLKEIYDSVCLKSK